MTVTLNLKPDTAARLRRNAARHEQTLTDYLLTLADADAASEKENFAEPAEVFSHYERHELTHGEAASLLGLTRAEFLDELGRRGLSPFQYSAAEVLAEAGLVCNCPTPPCL